MNAKEKAREIISKFEDENYFYESDMLENAKANAIIAVNLIIESISCDIDYWNEVKAEINSYDS